LLAGVCIAKAIETLALEIVCAEAVHFGKSEFLNLGRFALFG